MPKPYAPSAPAHAGKPSNAFSAREDQRTVGLSATQSKRGVIPGLSRHADLIATVELKEPSATAEDIRFLRLPDVKAVTGLSKTSLYALIREQSFPSPVRLGPRAVAWVRSEVNQWAADRVAASRPVGYEGVPKPADSVRPYLSGVSRRFA